VSVWGERKPPGVRSHFDFAPTRLIVLVMDPIDELREDMRRAGEEAREQRAADLAAGIARVGGSLDHPDYLRAYLRSGAVLLAHARATDSLDEFAIVCCYVQRHALELLIKELLSLFYGLADDRDALGVLVCEPVTSTAPSKNARKRHTTEHDLELLLRDLHCARQRAVDAGDQWRELPAELDALVAEFARLEGGIAETFRYDTVRLLKAQEISVETASGKEKEKEKEKEKREVLRQRTFKDEAVIPVADLQARLEALVEVLFWKQDDDLRSPIDSLGYELVTESTHLTDMLWRCGGLDKVVADGQ